MPSSEAHAPKMGNIFIGAKSQKMQKNAAQQIKNGTVAQDKTTVRVVLLNKFKKTQLARLETMQAITKVKMGFLNFALKTYCRLYNVNRKYKLLLKLPKQLKRLKKSLCALESEELHPENKQVDFEEEKKQSSMKIHRKALAKVRILTKLMKPSKSGHSHSPSKFLLNTSNNCYLAIEMSKPMKMLTKIQHNQKSQKL